MPARKQGERRVVRADSIAAVTTADGRLRVLHVAECFGGGVLRMINLVTTNVARAGAAQAIAYGRRPETPADPRQDFEQEVKLIALDWRRRSVRSQLDVARRLRRLCDDLQPHVIHLHSSFAGAIGCLVLGGRAPVIYTPHAFASTIDATPRWRRTLFRAIERFIVRRADIVGAVSESEAAIARALGARQTICIPNGIRELDPEQLALAAPDWSRPARPRVIAIGRLTPQRRPQACARILAGVADVAEIAWVGGGGEAGRRRRAACRALAAAGATPTGWRDREAVLDELRGATVYLHWTAGDGQALSLLEAMACDAVIVASDIPPNREILDAGQLCPGEREAIALIRRIIAEPAFAAELLRLQRERGAKHSASAMGKAWVELYAQLAPRSSENDAFQPRAAPATYE
jgi:glycosyltransferase involved in cell wall biosynthesis